MAGILLSLPSKGDYGDTPGNEIVNTPLPYLLNDSNNVLARVLVRHHPLSFRSWVLVLLRIRRDCPGVGSFSCGSCFPLASPPLWRLASSGSPSSLFSRFPGLSSLHLPPPRPRPRPRPRSLLLVPGALLFSSERLAACKRHSLSARMIPRAE